MCVTLPKGSSSSVFEDLVRFYQEKISTGVINWDLDLCEIEFMNSLAIGMMVAFNASLIHRNGKLRLILKKGSKVTDLILCTKIDKIIDVVIYG
jgi:anti-anti-sigma regulatory factor